MFAGIEQLDCFFAARNVRDIGRMAEVQNLKFLTDELVQAPVFFKKIIVVQTRNKQYIACLIVHQFLEIADAASGNIVAHFIDARHGSFFSRLYFFS
jgi:hypothetical protein